MYIHNIFIVLKLYYSLCLANYQEENKSAPPETSEQFKFLITNTIQFRYFSFSPFMERIKKIIVFARFPNKCMLGDRGPLLQIFISLFYLVKQQQNKCSRKELGQ